MNPKTLTEVMAYDPPPQANIIEHGILPQGQAMALYGDYGTWKSWLAMELGLSVSTGTQWLTYDTNQHRVMIINTELTEYLYGQRWKQLITRRSISSTDDLLVVSDQQFKVDSLKGMDALHRTVRHHKIRLVILDNLFSSMQGNINTNTDTNKLLDFFRMLQTEGVAIVIVHHTSKGIFDPGAGTNVNRMAFDMFGSSFIPNWLDTVFEVKHVQLPRFPDSVKIYPEKHRLAPLPVPGEVLQFSRARLEFRPVITYSVGDV